jgi:peroxiredoxin
MQQAFKFLAYEVARLRWWTFSILTLLWCLIAVAEQAESDSGVLRLVNGNQFYGQPQHSDVADMVHWQAESFLDPFVFDSAAIEVIDFPDRAASPPRDEFLIDCIDGDFISGNIVGWENDTLMIESDTLGTMQIQTKSIRSLHRARRGGRSLATFASVLDHDLVVPQRAQIDVELAWDGVPDFVFAMATEGVGPLNSADAQWKLETVGERLTAVGEQAATADVAVVCPLEKSSSIRLRIYLDQPAGELLGFDPTGAELARLKVSSQPSGGTGIRLLNRGAEVRLVQLRILPWTGPGPDQRQPELDQINLASGDSIAVTIESFAALDGRLTVSQQGQTRQLELADILSVQFADRAAVTQTKGTMFSLCHGNQLSGTITAVTADHWVLAHEKFVGEVRIPRKEVRRLIFVASDDAPLQAPLPLLGAQWGGHRVGRLSWTGQPNDQSSSLGWIVESDSAAVIDGNVGLSSLSWQPLASQRAARFAAGVSGRVVYKDFHISEKFMSSAGSVTHHDRAVRRLGDQSFGKLFLESVNRVHARRARRDQHVVHLRSGDMIQCRVDSISASGVTIATTAMDDVLIPHQQVRAIELVPHTQLPELDPDKRRRLLTLPRLQQSSPPTHVLCSADGDFLRCRLLRADFETIEVEVQTEVLAIDTERVTQVIWLAAEDSAAPSVPPGQYHGQLQALLSNQRRMTFTPTAASRTEIRGNSRWAGECAVEISKVDQLIFGDAIADEASKLPYADWQLSAAELPLIAQSTAATAPERAALALVGQPAPLFQLERLDGGGIDLSEYRGQIVVLDFWASWCAPCIESMPAVVEAIGEFESPEIVLVSVNLEERREEVQAAMDRLGLTMLVALDTAGTAARSYQATAIPQTVVVDAQGKIAAIVVGGTKEALTKLKVTIRNLLQPD